MTRSTRLHVLLSKCLYFFLVCLLLLAVAMGPLSKLISDDTILREDYIPASDLPAPTVTLCKVVQRGGCHDPILVTFICLKDRSQD